MKETFDFRRFGKYYISDLKAVVSNSWITVLVTALSGIIAYLFCGMIHLIVTGDWASYGLAGRAITFTITFFVLLLTIPSKAYGSFTDKKAGSFYTLVPVSAWEKFISMFINVCIVAPLAFTAISLASDGLLCLVDKQCGESLISVIASGTEEINNLLDDINETANFKTFSAGEIVFSQIISSISFILTFLLGALYFKNHKIGKTILAYIVVSMALSLVSTPLLAAFGEDLFNIAFDDTQQLMTILKIVGHSINILFMVGLSVWAYIRVKTVKY